MKDHPRTFWIGLVGATVLLSTGPSPAEVPAEHRHEVADRLANHLLNELRTKPKPCPEPLSHQGVISVMYCGKTGGLKARNPFEPMARIDALITPHAEAFSSWESRQRTHRRVYDLGGLRILVYLDSRRGIAGLQYPRQNFGCITDPTVPRGPWHDPPISNPILIEHTKVDPAYPEDARNSRVDGTVAVEAIVSEDGTVTDLCVANTSPDGYGFGKVALEAVRQWRYKPARLEGRPIAVRFMVIVSFSIF